jgi:hypothetical protein
VQFAGLAIQSAAQVMQYLLSNVESPVSPSTETSMVPVTARSTVEGSSIFGAHGTPSSDENAAHDSPPVYVDTTGAYKT